MAKNAHELAVAAEEKLEQLATALGEADTPPETVQAVTQMASVIREIVKALGAPLEDEAPDPDDPDAAPEAQAPAQPATIGEAVDSMGA